MDFHHKTQIFIQIHPFAQPLAPTLVPFLVAPEHPIAPDENARMQLFCDFFKNHIIYKEIKFKKKNKKEDLI